MSEFCDRGEVGCGCHWVFGGLGKRAIIAAEMEEGVETIFNIGWRGGGNDIAGNHSCKGSFRNPVESVSEYSANPAEEGHESGGMVVAVGSECGGDSDPGCEEAVDHDHGGSDKEGIAVFAVDGGEFFCDVADCSRMVVCGGGEKVARPGGGGGGGTGIGREVKGCESEHAVHYVGTGVSWGALETGHQNAEVHTNWRYHVAPEELDCGSGRGCVCC